MVRVLRLSKSLVGSYTPVYSGGGNASVNYNPSVGSVRHKTSSRSGGRRNYSISKPTNTASKQGDDDHWYEWTLVLKNPALRKRAIYYYLLGYRIHAPPDIMEKLRAYSNEYLDDLARKLMSGEELNVPPEIRAVVEKYVLSLPKTKANEHTTTYIGVVNHKVRNLPT